MKRLFMNLIPLIPLSWKEKGEIKRGMGFTLVELLISLAISSLALAVMGTAFYTFLALPPKSTDKMTAVHDLEQVNYWLTRDGNSAESFSALSNPQYGSFPWVDRTVSPTVTYLITYSFSGGELRREEKQNDVVQNTIAVARNISSYSDVSFNWFPSTYSLRVYVTSTVVGDYTLQPAVHNTSITTALRPRSDPLVSQPGATPVPTPPPGSVIYYAATGPTILAGTYASGNLASLQSDDNNYYVVNSSGGGAKYATWWTQSQVMSSPDPIGGIEVRWTGKADKTNIVVNFYVVNPATGDFDTTPASGFTFTVADSEQTHSFPLDAAVVTYINGLPSPVTKLKVESFGTATFALYAERLIFIASP